MTGALFFAARGARRMQLAVHVDVAPGLAVAWHRARRIAQLLGTAAALLVASALLPSHRAVRAPVAGATDRFELRDRPDARVDERLVRERRRSASSGGGARHATRLVYDVAFDSGHRITCRGRQTSAAPFPVSTATGAPACQRRAWNVCDATVEYRGRPGGRASHGVVLRDVAGPCAARVGAEATFYYDARADRLMATDAARVARWLMYGVAALSCAGAAWHGRRLARGE